MTESRRDGTYRRQCDEGDFPSLFATEPTGTLSTGILNLPPDFVPVPIIELPWLATVRKNGSNYIAAH